MTKKNVTLSDEVITEKEHARRYEEETKKVTSNIYKKIFEVQHECKTVIKDPKKGLQYKSLTYNSVNGIVRPALKKAKLTLIPYVKSHEQDGNQTRCVMAARVVDIETGFSMNTKSKIKSSILNELCIAIDNLNTKNIGWINLRMTL